MIFIENKYTTIYFNIVNRAKLRNLEGYSEQHHIIPKSLGGNNSRDNLVKLTAKEHFICHLLLTRMTDSVSKKKMVHALCMMMDMHSGNQSRYIPCSTLYEQARKQRAKMMSLYNSGSNNPMFGKKHSEETRKKLKEAAKFKSKPSKELIEKRRQTLISKNYKHSLETREKMKESAKGREVGTCKFCGITCITSLLKRWHNENCKLNKSCNTSQHDPTISLPIVRTLHLQLQILDTENPDCTLE